MLPYVPDLGYGRIKPTGGPIFRNTVRAVALALSKVYDEPVELRTRY